MPRILDNRNEETSENLASVLYLNSLSIQIVDNLKGGGEEFILVPNILHCTKKA